MPKRRNETEVMMRSVPYAYRAAFDINLNPEYEGWASPGSAEGKTEWLILKNTYNADNNLTKTEWATNTGEPPAQFNQIWTNYATLTYV